MFILFKKNLPYIIFTLPLLIDTLNGILRGSDGSDDSLIGILFKSIIILYSILVTHSLKSKYIEILLSIGLICFMAQFFLGTFSFSVVTSYIKSIYAFFVLYILIKSPWCKEEFTVYKSAIFYGAGASAILLCSYLGGWGYSSYVSDSSFGVKGFFISMNDICLTILLMNCLSVLYFQKTKSLCYLICMIIMCLGNVLTGSMAAIFGTFIIIVFWVFSTFIISYEKYKSTVLEKTVAGIIVFVVIGNGGRWVYQSINNDDYLSKKYENAYTVFSEVSGRKTLIEASKKVIENRNVLFDIFGQGQQYTNDISKNVGIGNKDGGKSAEVDYLDLLGKYGVFVMIFLFYYPIKMTITSMLKLFKRRTIDYYWLAISSLIFVGHSFYGGHALTSPMSFSYFIVFVYLGRKLKLIKFY